MPNIELTEEEIAKLALSIEDPIRQQELQGLLPGEESFIVCFRNVTIVNDERGIAHVTITKRKNEMDVSRQDHVVTFSNESVNAMCNLIKTLPEITSLQI